MELSGRLGMISVAELLQWPHHERRSGSLVVRTSRREKRVLFERGMIVGCVSGDPSEYFGQHLLLHGYLDRPQLLQALAACQAAGVRLGTALVDLGILPAAAAADALASHVAERVCDLFLWEHGVFYFLQELPAGLERLDPPLDPVGVALEGSRWADELARIREVLVHDGVVVRRGAAGGPPQDEREARILAALDPPRRLDELAEAVQGSRFRCLETLYRLLVAGRVDVERLEESPPQSDIRMFDLLLEQAVTEEVLFSSRHLALPLEWLERFYPLWVEGDEPPPVSAEELELYRRMDGSRSLHELVLAEPGRRQERMDLLLLQLQHGRLALLPRPLPELRALGRGARNPWLRKLLG